MIQKFRSGVAGVILLLQVFNPNSSLAGVGICNHAKAMTIAGAVMFGSTTCCCLSTFLAPAVVLCGVGCVECGVCDSCCGGTADNRAAAPAAAIAAAQTPQLATAPAETTATSNLSAACPTAPGAPVTPEWTPDLDPNYVPPVPPVAAQSPVAAQLPVAAQAHTGCKECLSQCCSGCFNCLSSCCYNSIEEKPTSCGRCCSMCTGLLCSASQVVGAVLLGEKSSNFSFEKITIEKLALLGLTISPENAKRYLEIYEEQLPELNLIQQEILKHTSVIQEPDTKQIKDPEALKKAWNEYYLKTAQEGSRIWKQYTQSLEPETLEIVQAWARRQFQF